MDYEALREAMKRADTAQHWSDIARRELQETIDLRADIYDLLRQEGYHEGSYNSLSLPESTERAVEPGKYCPAISHILQVVQHLIERARTAEQAAVAATKAKGE